MPVRNRFAVRAAALALTSALALKLAACAPEPENQTEEAAAIPTEKLGLMTSLPLYWPLGADFAEIANGSAQIPWQRGVLERDYELVLLDTLSPIPGLTPDAPESDPLEGLERLAVIQPRGLSPSDNVALDEWVRGGGQLLIALDPMLTGEYDVALGDPKRPNDTALVPPVVPRWGIAGGFSMAQTEERFADLPEGRVPALMASELRAVTVDSGSNGCHTDESLLVVRCETVGKGTVTLIGDAAVFEHRELAGEDGEAIGALLRFAFRQ